MGEPDQKIAAARDADAGDSADPRPLDHGANVLGVLTQAIGTLQRVRCAGAARVDRDDAELLAEPLDDRLKHFQAIDDGIDEQERLVAGAVQVVGDPGAVAERDAGPVPLALDAVAPRGVGCERDGGVVALICGLEVAHQAVQVALQLERPAADRFERRIALGDRLRPLRKLQRGRIGISLLRFFRRAQEILGSLRPDGALLEMVRQGLDDLVEVICVARLEGFGDAAVQRAAAFVKHAVIGDAPGEPVPEGVGDVREQARLVQKLARPQAGQRAMQLLRRQLGHGLEQCERHVFADHRGELKRRLLGRAEAVDARGDDRGDARGDLDLVRPPDHAVGAACAGQHARVHQNAHALFQEQRIALARLEQPTLELRRDRARRRAGPRAARRRLSPRADRCAAACSGPGWPSRADSRDGS